MLKTKIENTLGENQPVIGVDRSTLDRSFVSRQMVEYKPKSLFVCNRIIINLTLTKGIAGLL